MSGESSIPGAVDGLLTLFAGWPALAGVDIRDALTAPDEQAAQAVFVGYQDPTGLTAANSVDTAVDMTATHADLGGRDRERYTIHCAAAAIDGNGDYGIARRAAYALHSAARAAIGTSRDLGGSIQGTAVVATGSLRYELIPEVGIKALAMFDVVVDAFTNP